jgi:hypothetical protein
VVLSLLIASSAFAASSGQNLAKTLAPGEGHEECLPMKAGQRLSYSFESDTNLDFNVHYHVGEDVTYPVEKDGTRRERGELQVTVPQDYCLMWVSSGQSPSLLIYSFEVREK